MGTLKPDPRFEISFNQLEGLFDIKTVGAQHPMEIIIDQPVPDANLRIVVWNSPLGYISKEKTAWWRAEQESAWLQGIPSALTGMPASGIPIIWLQNVQ